MFGTELDYYASILAEDLSKLLQEMQVVENVVKDAQHYLTHDRNAVIAECNSEHPDEFK